MPVNARRCPDCGVYLKADSRRLTIYLGVLGILAVLVVVAIGLFLKPATVDLENTPEAERTQAPPPKPAKKPPLD